MKRTVLFALLALLLASCSASRFSYSWHRIPADGHRTGVTAPNSENAVQALGVSNGEFYSAPNGKIFVGGSTPEVAELLFSVQDEMKDLKTVVGHSENGMTSYKPESPLSDWAADALLEGAEKITGLHVDMSITNFGGIRCNIPKGEVLKDDIVSMFPFKNYVAVVTLSGTRLKEILEKLASERIEAIGGCRLVIRDGKLESATIGGKPLDESATYRLATIDFLLNGGDGHDYGERVEDVLQTDVLMIDVMLPKVLEMTAKGQSIDYATDGRVLIINGDENS